MLANFPRQRLVSCSPEIGNNHRVFQFERGYWVQDDFGLGKVFCKVAHAVFCHVGRSILDGRVDNDIVLQAEVAGFFR